MLLAIFTQTQVYRSSYNLQLTTLHAHLVHYHHHLIAHSSHGQMLLLLLDYQATYKQLSKQVISISQ